MTGVDQVGLKDQENFGFDRVEGCDGCLLAAEKYDLEAIGP